MKLEKAIEIILDYARAPGGNQDVADAADIVEDFFVNNVWDGTDEISDV